MRSVKNLSLCVLLLALVNSAAGATLYVPGDSDTIQGAIDAAVPGDEIEVAPGTYSESINFLGKAIRLYSSGGPDVTIIDASELSSSVVTCLSGETVSTRLEGFTVTGGNAYNGGGMFNSGSSPTVTDCIFSSNVATRGGGMLNDQNSSPNVTNCIFAYNAGTYGGGMYNAYGSNSTVTNCTFQNNHSGWFGGGMDNAHDASPTVTNCTFTGNWGYFGGGMFNENLSSPTVVNCTFTGNGSPNGGGIYMKVGCSPTVANCILWGDTSEIVVSDSTPTVTYSDVQGGWTGTGNIDVDPIFADADGRLSPDSPCIDVGNNGAVPPGVTTDLDGNPRIVNDVVDMGAYEYPITLVQIDIKPGSYPNAININGNGVIPVAILGSAEFDATQVVIGSLSFAGLEVRVKPNGASQYSISDVSGPEGVPDGYDDLVCQFVDDPLLWLPGNGFADLTGMFLVDGMSLAPFEGSDEITIVP